MCGYFPKGIEIGGTEAMEHFDKTEQYDRNLVSKGKKLLTFIFTTLIFQSGSGPILYIITGAPQPDEWFSQLQMK